MEKKLRTKFYLEFIPLLICVLSSITLISICLVHLWKQYVHNDIKIFLPIVCSIMSFIVIIIFLIALIPFLKDLKSVINNTFINVTAVVIGYNKKEYAGEPPETIYWPVFKIIGTDEKIQLYVHEATKINKTYRVIYLKHTKKAEVLEVEQ